MMNRIVTNNAAFLGFFVVLVLASLSGCAPASMRMVSDAPENPIESAIPSIQIKSEAGKLDISLFVSGKVNALPIEKVVFKSESVIRGLIPGTTPSVENLEKEIKSFSFHRVHTPLVTADISGHSVTLSGSITEIRIQMDRSEFKTDPLSQDFNSGIFTVNLNDGAKIYKRSFEKIPELDVVSMDKTLLKGIKEKDSKSPLFIPVTIFDAMPTKDDKETLRMLQIVSDGVAESWGESCGIRVRIQNYVFSKEKPLSVPGSLSAEISPELIYLQRQVRKTVGESDSSVLILANVGINWPSRFDEETTTPVGYSFLIFGATFRAFQSESRGFFNQGIVLLKYLTDVGALTHELGHILLGKDHDSDSQNVMRPVVGGNIIRSDQCERARGYIQSHY